MNLREQAERDLAVTLEDADGGFGWRVEVIDTAGRSAFVTAQAGDVGQTIDPDTGQVVVGREAHVALRIRTLEEKGLGLPPETPTADAYRVNFDDINGKPHTFKVLRPFYDRTLGVVTCQLGAYDAT